MLKRTAIALTLARTPWATIRRRLVGVMLSKPRSNCSSVINVDDAVARLVVAAEQGERRSGGSNGAAAASGSSTSTFFWIEWMSDSRMSRVGGPARRSRATQ